MSRLRPAVASFFLASLLLAPCAAAGEPSPPDATPRETYNRAIDALDAEDLDAAQEGLLAARDHAGADAELRYRAAFNLGMTYAARAAKIEDDPSAALDPLRNAAAWFRDAVRLRPEDADARVNLDVILRRIRRIADAIERGGDTLEAHLERLVRDERSLRDRARALVARSDSPEPISLDEEFRELAAWQRTLLADADDAAARAAEEHGHLAQTSEKNRTDRDRLRLAQLEACEPALRAARERMADARSTLRRLLGEEAHRRIAAALRLLERAREPFLDPIATLKALARDQQLAMVHTETLRLGRSPKVQMNRNDDPPPPPAWLTPAFLIEAQQDILVRTQGIRAGFEAAGAARNRTPEEEEPPARDDAAARRILDAAAEALPHLEEGCAAMTDAVRALEADDPAAAVPLEGRALAALLRAIERFAGIRDLIELAFADQEGIVALLTPPEAPDAANVEDLPPPERERRVREAIDRNRERLDRLRTLFAEERAAMDAPPQDPATGQPGGPDPAAAEREQRRFDLAETLRAAAAEALAHLGGAMDDPTAGAPLPPARLTLQHIRELRSLFSLIVEHLEDLLRDQARTADDTAAAASASEDPPQRAARLAALGPPQEGHAQTARAIEAALREAATAPAPTQPPFDRAADEVGLAVPPMETARTGLEEETPNVEEILDAQNEAMEHLAAAIALLRPPQPPEPPQEEDGKKKEEDRPQPISREEAERRLQAVREREADRRRHLGDTRPREPVEKDW